MRFLPVSLWAKINDYIHKLGNEGTANGALSSIDIARSLDQDGGSVGEDLRRALRDGRRRETNVDDGVGA